MYLDATEVNYYVKNGKQVSADNAAVQSIRKSKVKCYDLIVQKSTTDSSAVSFYVNGGNAAADGVKYPAYLYVENCISNVTRDDGGVSTADVYFFYYNGMKRNSGDVEYTNESKSYKGSIISNVALEWNDWDWEK
jgi:hypothetical protein